MAEEYVNNNQEVSQTQNPEMSVGEWVLTIFILALPLVGLIMLFVWAFGNDQYKSRQNFAKASLIWLLIVVGLYLIIILAFSSTIFGLYNNL